jgi:hypothetical protein
MIKLVDLLSEVIKKVDGKWVVYPKKGGKRLGTHATKEKALKQLAAIEINKENVNEVGDASADAYKWKPVGRGIYSNEFTFTTDSGLEYYVKFWDVGDDTIEVAFLAEEPDQYDRAEYSTVTNRGELFKVMSTVAVIVLYYLQSNPEYKYLTYEPSKTTGKDDNRRDKLYRAYMKKMIPGSEEVPADVPEYIKFKLP